MSLDQHAAHTPDLLPSQGSARLHSAQIDGRKVSAKAAASVAMPAENIPGFHKRRRDADAAAALPVYSVREVAMRLTTMFVLVALLWAGAAGAQTYWLGAGAGTSWEYEADTAPGHTLLHGNGVAPSVFAALALNDDTLIRLRGFRLPRETSSGGMAWPGHLRGLTLGVDYLMTGGIGTAVISGGLGAYRLDLDARTPPPGIEQTRLGWYLGIGEWFTITRHLQAILEVTYDRTSHVGTPQMLTATGGLACTF